MFCGGGGKYQKTPLWKKLCKGTAFFTYKQDCYTNFYAKLIKIYLLQSFLRIAKFFSLFPFHFSSYSAAVLQHRGPTA